MTRAGRVAFAQIALAAAFVAPAPLAWAADKVKVSFAATDDAVYLPFFLAIDKGYYRKLDLDVETVNLGGGIATPALLSGRLDFSTSTGSATSAILSGAALKIVLTLSETVPWKLWATRPEIRTLADLKGKAVGVQTRGDLFELSMRAVLRKAGLDEDFVAYIPLGFGNAQRLGVVKSGSLPAILLSNFEERIARERGALGQSHILLDMGKDVRIPNNGLATSDKLIAANPSVVERMIRATVMGMRYMKVQRAGALKMFAQRVPDVPIDVLRASIDDTANMLLDDGTTSPAVQDAELALRGAMMGKAPDQGPTRAKVFDYSLALKAAQTLQASQWVPSE